MFKVIAASFALILATVGLADAQSRDPFAQRGSTSKPGGSSGGSSSAPASGDNVDAKNPSSLVARMQDLGYRATLKKGSDGAPFISGRLSSSNYDIFFYGCTAEKDCTHIEFMATWDVEKKYTVADANKWNNDKLVGRASILDDGAARLTFFYNLDGSVGKSNFEDTLDWWRIALTEYEQAIGYVK